MEMKSGEREREEEREVRGKEVERNNTDSS